MIAPLRSRFTIGRSSINLSRALLDADQINREHRRDQTDRSDRPRHFTAARRRSDGDGHHRDQDHLAVSDQGGRLVDLIISFTKGMAI